MARTTGTTSRRRWIVVGVVTTLALALVAGFLLLRSTNGARPTTRTDDVAVTRSTEQVTVSLTGALASARQAELSFGAPGKVTAVTATVGQQVTQGTVLAQIDDTTLRDAVALASAQLTAARANLTQVRSTSGATPAQIASARAQVTSADARLASARNQLASASITAPFEGTVAAVTIEVGDQATGSAPTSSGLATGTLGAGVGQAAIVLVTPSEWIVNGTVGPADVGALEPGQAATVTVQGTSVSAPATVRTVGIVATTTSGATAFPVTLAIQGSPVGLYYGASVNVVVDAGTFPDVISVPTAALSTEGTATTVEKVADGVATTTPVTTGQVFGERTQVTSGLAEGDLVRVTIRVTPQPRRSGGFGGLTGPPPGLSRNGTGG